MAILLAETLITLGASPNPGLSTSSAGRAKKDWGRCWESVVAMGVAWEGLCVGVLRTGDNLITAHPAQLPQHFSALVIFDVVP